MKLTNDIRMAAHWANGHSLLISEDNEAIAEEKPAIEEPAAFLDITDEGYTKAIKGLDYKALAPINKDGKQNSQKSRLQDASGRLTKMLVSAKSTGEVQAILTQAQQNMGDVMKAAASGDKEAMAIVRRLHKLMRRANQKIRDLTKEDEVSKKQKRAKEKELEQLSKQLEDELKRKIALRKQKEKRYLLDPSVRNSKKQQPSQDSSISTAELEAKMRMLEFAFKTAHSAVSPAFSQSAAPTSTDGAETAENIEP